MLLKYLFIRTACRVVQNQYCADHRIALERVVRLRLSSCVGSRFTAFFTARCRRASSAAIGSSEAPATTAGMLDARTPRPSRTACQVSAENDSSSMGATRPRAWNAASLNVASIGGARCRPQTEPRRGAGASCADRAFDSACVVSLVRRDTNYWTAHLGRGCASLPHAGWVIR